MIVSIALWNGNIEDAIVNMKRLLKELDKEEDIEPGIENDINVRSMNVTAMDQDREDIEKIIFFLSSLLGE